MAQVSSGSFTTNASENRSLKFNWSVDNTSISGNYKEIYWSLEGSGSASGYVMAGDFKVVIDGEIVYNSSTRIELWNGTVVASGYKKLYHNASGNKTFSASVQASIYEYEIDNKGSGTWELPTIPRYATSVQGLSGKTETSITMKWSSDNTVDYIWYSKDNGTNWTGIDVTDGKSGSYTISGLKANTTYNIKTRVRRKDSQLKTDSSALSVTTYSYPTQSFKSKTETSVTMNWSCDSTVDYIWYSSDNGSTWTAKNVTDGKSGSYTISGLKAKTTYKIKTRVRRKATQTKSDTSALSVTTYSYPTQSLNSKTETTIAINWSCDSTVDYIWYSKDNGSNWTGIDVTDGKSGSYTISSLSADTTYKIKTRVRRKDTQTKSDSSALSVVTYGLPTQSFKSKTETSITMNWKCDSTVDYIWYSKDNGSNWTGKNVTDGTSGSYTISGLSANTTYKVKVRVRRKATQTKSDSSATSVATYNYPYCNNMPNFTIGDRLTVRIYNPLGRTYLLEMVGDNGTVQRVGEYNTESVTGFVSTAWQNIWYATIPNSKSGTYKMRVTYGSSVITKTGGTYKIKGTETPTVGTITYADTNTTSTAVTGNNQHIVQNQSNLKVTYTSATAKNSATISKYTFELNGVTKTSTSAGGTVDFGKVNSAKNLKLTMTVTDSRGLTATSTKTVTFLAHSKPTAKVTLKRLNNYENETYLTIDGSVSSVNSKNTMAIKYRYKASGGSYNSYTTISDNTKQTLSLDKGKSYIFNVVVTDAFGTTYNKEHVLNKGVFPLFIDTGLNSVGINTFPTEENALEIEGKLLVKNRLLWSGTLYMYDTQSLNLAEPISKQANGIVLVFSRYSDGAKDDNFNTFFMSKKMVELKAGCGHTFTMFRSASNPFAEACVKYLYIEDTKITGHAQNDDTGTGGCGITYNNKAFVLRYVIGV